MAFFVSFQNKTNFTRLESVTKKNGEITNSIVKYLNGLIEYKKEICLRILPAR